MSENRKIEVMTEIDRWAEGDRNVLVQLHHNENQRTSFLLSREEAMALAIDLRNYVRLLEQGEES